MCLRLFSSVFFLNPESSMESDKFDKIFDIFSDSLEYFPKSIIRRIIIKINIGNTTCEVMV